MSNVIVGAAGKAMCTGGGEVTITGESGSGRSYPRDARCLDKADGSM